MRSLSVTSRDSHPSIRSTIRSMALSQLSVLSARGRISFTLHTESRFHRYRKRSYSETARAQGESHVSPLISPHLHQWCKGRKIRIRSAPPRVLVSSHSKQSLLGLGNGHQHHRRDMKVRSCRLFPIFRVAPYIAIGTIDFPTLNLCAR